MRSVVTFFRLTGLLLAIVLIGMSTTASATQVQRVAGARSVAFAYVPNDGIPGELAQFFIEDKVLGYLRYAIDPSTGSGAYSIKITNGHGSFNPQGGGNFCIETIFRSSDDRNHLTLMHTLGVNARAERNESYQLSEPAGFWKRISTIDITWGKCPSDSINRDIGQFFESVGNAAKSVGSLFSFENYNETPTKGTVGPPSSKTNWKFIATGELPCVEKSGDTDNLRTGTLNPIFGSDVSCSAARKLLDEWQDRGDECSTQWKNYKASGPLRITSMCQ